MIVDRLSFRDMVLHLQFSQLDTDIEVLGAISFCYLAILVVRRLKDLRFIFSQSFAFIVKILLYNNMGVRSLPAFILRKRVLEGVMSLLDIVGSVLLFDGLQFGQVFARGLVISEI
jgi:hypothetical protein